MSKPYWSGPGGRGASRFADDGHAGSDPGNSGYESGYDGYGGYRGHDHTDAGDAPTDVYPEYEEYDDYPSDTRWRWVAGLAAIVLLVALVAIAVATRGGDTSTSATTPSGAPDQDAITATTPRTVIATVAPTVSPSPTAALPPETIVTVTPSPSAEAPPPPEAAPAPAEATPPGQTITYTVTGTRQLFDLVSIIYTDEQGFPRTDVNVALPWTKTVVLNPGVETRSVTATSLTGQLNCSVTDGSGTTIAAQSNNAAIATCTP
jgi:hypothetical protein